MLVALTACLHQQHLGKSETVTGMGMGIGNAGTSDRTAEQAKRAYAGEFRADLINPQLPPKSNGFFSGFAPKRKVVSSQMAFGMFGYMK